MNDVILENSEPTNETFSLDHESDPSANKENLQQNCSTNETAETMMQTQQYEALFRERMTKMENLICQSKSCQWGLLSREILFDKFKESVKLKRQKKKGEYDRFLQGFQHLRKLSKPYKEQGKSKYKRRFRTKYAIDQEIICQKHLCILLKIRPAALVGHRDYVLKEHKEKKGKKKEKFRI